MGLGGAPLDLRSPARAMRAGVALVPEQRRVAVFADQSLAENLSLADLTGSGPADGSTGGPSGGPPPRTSPSSGS